MDEFRLKKDLGQNFLKNRTYINLAVKSLDIKEDDYILEIGTGDGAITSLLVNAVPAPAKIVTYEIDQALIPILNEKFALADNLRILNENFLDSVPQSWGRANKAIGAIPYYITSPIIHRLLKKERPLDNIVLIIQKEVADKICPRGKNKKNYWSYLPFIYDIKMVATIKRNNFHPVPNVDSQIIQFKLNEEKREIFRKKRIEIVHWEAFLHRLFTHPRKMISHNYDEIDLKEVEIDPHLRAHQLSEKQVIDLFLDQRKSGIL